MGKIKVKRKSTLIDMTAMSDVTVLLLTFFMLTSTFLQKEPTQVITPPSVSTTKVETSNVAQILVGTDPTGQQAKVYLSLMGEADPDVPESDPGSWSSENVRKETFTRAVQAYQNMTGRRLFNSNGEIALYAEKFAKIGSFGVPFRNLKEVLDMDQSEQDAFIGDMTNPDSGIPLETRNGINEFQIWMTAVRDGSNENLRDAMRRSGSGIAIKADQNTSFNLVNSVLENLRALKLNKFTVMTALKTEND